MRFCVEIMAEFAKLSMFAIGRNRDGLGERLYDSFVVRV